MRMNNRRIMIRIEMWREELNCRENEELTFKRPREGPKVVAIVKEGVKTCHLYARRN